MATNRIFEDATQLYLPVDSGIESGEPVLIGAALPAVALTDRDADGYATVQTNGAFDLPIVTASGAIAVGDIIYIVAADNTLTRTVGSNVRFGYALETLGSNTAGTIRVKVGY